VFISASACNKVSQNFNYIDATFEELNIYRVYLCDV
jgi:hypothetical protein